MCIEWLKKIICKPKVNIQPPKIKNDLDHSEALTILKSELGTKCKIYLSDMLYKTTSKEEIERFLAEDDTNYYKYVSEFFDCDDFSYRLHGQLSVPGWSDLAFGIFWTGLPNGGGHALNIFIDNEDKVWIVEPQNDKVYELPDDWEPWLVVM